MIVEDIGRVPFYSRIPSGFQSLRGRALQTARRRSGAAGTQKQMKDNFGLSFNILFISGVIRSVKVKICTFFSIFVKQTGLEKSYISSLYYYLLLKKVFRFCSPTEIFPEYLLSASSVYNRYVIHSLSKTAQKIKRTPTKLLAAHQERLLHFFSHSRRYESC